jgi:hypothetical protein
VNDSLSTKENLQHLIDRSGKWIDQAHRHRKLIKLILDMDSPMRETYGHQQGTAYNQFGDLERVMLRRGNHPSDKFWRRHLLPVLERYRDRDISKYFPGDSTFALPKLLRLLEKEGFRHATRDRIGWPCSAVSWMRLSPCRDGGSCGRGSVGPHWRSPSSASISPLHDGPALQAVRTREQ